MGRQSIIGRHEAFNSPRRWLAANLHSFEAIPQFVAKAIGGNCNDVLLTNASRRGVPCSSGN